ncbi:large ribosomal subunit protein uL1m [Tiliqua scincoides]|uniref:large ribosomal subunit protein uL1m n=1 Tax=Tiliqua scincoides TaxID=71010 RepID=UPI0034636D07
MAAPMGRGLLWAVSAHCARHLFSRIAHHSAVVPSLVNMRISNRHYAVKTRKKSKNDTQKKTLESEPKQKKKHNRPPLPSEPTDDVYLTWCYQRQVYEAEVALDMLKKFQQLDFTSPNQHVYANITLDMAMDKKKTVEQFVGTLLLPYRYTDGTHKVLLFTENAEEAALAKEHGAALVGGTELIKPILDGEIQADFYVAVPPMVSKLSALRSTLKKKFPKTKDGSLSYDIPQMLSFFKVCHEYAVEDENSIQSQIATLDMPNDQIVANLDALIKDTCKYKPLSYGPFVTSLIMRSSTSEGLYVQFERFLPEGAVKEKVKVEEMEEKDSDSDDEEEKIREAK